MAVQLVDGHDWERIINCSLDGIFIADGDGKALYANKAYEQMSGLSREEITGTSLKSFAGEKRYISNSITLEVIRTRKSMTGEQILFRTGKKVLITCNPVFDENGELELVVSNVRDMTEVEHLQQMYIEALKENRRVREDLQLLRDQTQKDSHYIAEDKKMLKVFKLAERVALSDSTVLLTGETGVGKEVLAQYIHENSLRRNERFIRVNCGAIAESLFESELFGYEKGAFTGANKEGKKGLFEMADKGTLFLDEVGELPFDMQAKLLRVLQEKEITRVGGSDTISVDVRVIAATNRDLEEMIKEKAFRSDLFYRLSVIMIRLPALRERKNDILALANHFMSQLNKKYANDKYLIPGCEENLMAYSWPGNIRELKNVVERAYVMSSADGLWISNLNDQLQEGFSEEDDDAENDFVDPKEYLGKLSKHLETEEYRLMKEAYRKKGNIRDAAAYLKMTKSTFCTKMQKYNEKYLSASADD